MEYVFRVEFWAILKTTKPHVCYREYFARGLLIFQTSMAKVTKYLEASKQTRHI